MGCEKKSSIVTHNMLRKNCTYGAKIKVKVTKSFCYTYNFGSCWCVIVVHKLLPWPKNSWSDMHTLSGHAFCMQVWKKYMVPHQNVGLGLSKRRVQHWAPPLSSQAFRVNTVWYCVDRWNEQRFASQSAVGRLQFASYDRNSYLLSSRNHTHHLFWRLRSIFRRVATL